MPTYEYRCNACGHAFERFQKMTDRVVRTCPECKEKKVERLISSGGGLVFKGPGFYATDYRKDGPPKEAGGQGSGSEAGAKGQGKAEGKGEKSASGDDA